jgi:GWxTD domain-containing protein
MQIGHAYLVGETQNLMYLLSSYDQLSYEFDRKYLYQNISIVIDSMKVNILDRVYTYKDLQPTSYIPVEYDDPVHSVQKISLSYFESNIMYKAEPFLYGAWYSYGSTYSLKDQMNQLRYIATQNEWNTLRKIPSSRHFEAIEQFWEKHDPSPGTQRNEAREEFYQRVITADEKYTIHARLKGWKSDRGRIYIKYGLPDEIVSEAYPSDSPPYIVWHYYTQNLRFIFVDSKGFGQYTLSNKEEEYDGF